MNMIFIVFFSFLCSSESPSLSTLDSSNSISNNSYDGNDPLVYFNMYQVCLGNDDIGCASSNLNKAIKLDPKNEDYKALSFSLQDYLELLNRASKTIERELYQ